jgi:hypothetical protein
MELDEYKKTVPDEMAYQEMDPEVFSAIFHNLTEEMKEKDRQDRRALLYLMIFFIAFSVIYLALMNRQEGVMRTGYTLLAGGFILTLLHFFLKFRKYKKINYSEPVFRFLRSAEQRYAYWPLLEILIDIPLITMMGIGGGLIVYGSFQKYFPGSPVPVVVYCLILIAACITGYLAGKKQWERSKRPLYEKIRQMRREFGD